MDTFPAPLSIATLIDGHR